MAESHPAEVEVIESAGAVRGCAPAVVVVRGCAYSRPPGLAWMATVLRHALRVPAEGGETAA